MKPPRSGGGWAAIWYTLSKSREAGGLRAMWAALRSPNACKTCALGMGGQRGGMVNEAGRFPEVCKKSVQAMAADMRGRIRPGFFEEFQFDKLDRFTPRELEAAGRITEPLYAASGDRSFRALSWDDALTRIGRTMQATAPDRSFFYFSGRSSNEAGFLLQLVARLYGTNNVNNCSYYCHQASGVALADTIGTHAGTVSLDDLDECDFAILIGANPASNHPRLMRTLMDLRRRGGEVVVINPVREIGLVRFNVPSDVRSLLFGSVIASQYLQPHIGGDAALIMAICKAIIEQRAHDESYLNAHVDGWEEHRAHLSALSWEMLLAEAGVTRTEIDAAASAYARSKRAMFCWAMGMTHHEHGVRNVQAIVNLALLRGMVGKPGAGLLPLRGHSNVQGIGSVGVVPHLKDMVLEKLERQFGVTLPKAPGMDTMACMDAAAAGDVDFAMCLGGNLYGSNPDAMYARRALNAIGQVVYLSTTLNTGHIHGRGRETIILPVLARDEEPEPTTQESMFSYVRLSDGGPPRFDGPRSEVTVIADLAQRALDPALPIDWADMRRHASIRGAISRIIPGYEQVGEIDRTKREFVIPGRRFTEPTFNTPTGRAQMRTFDPPGLKTGDGRSLRVLTLRSEGQFNTVVYEDEDRYRGQERRDVILMHPIDIARFGLRENDRVTVRTEIGAMPGVLVRAFDIRPGNAAMYYPEANILVPRAVDPASKTPAFKSFIARIDPERSLPVLNGA